MRTTTSLGEALLAFAVGASLAAFGLARLRHWERDEPGTAEGDPLPGSVGFGCVGFGAILVGFVLFAVAFWNLFSP